MQVSRLHHANQRDGLGGKVFLLDPGFVGRMPVNTTKVVGSGKCDLSKIGGGEHDHNEPDAMRLFCFYNWKYTARCVFAEDKETAKALAIKSGHVRGNRFRRITELTLEDESWTPEEAAALERALASGKTGMAEYNRTTNEWIIREI